MNHQKTRLNVRESIFSNFQNKFKNQQNFDFSSFFLENFCWKSQFEALEIYSNPLLKIYNSLKSFFFKYQHTREIKDRNYTFDSVTLKL